MTTVVVESPGRDSKKGGGFSGTALGRRPQNRTKGADPRTGTLKRETCFCPGVLSSLCPGLPCRASQVPGRCFSGPAAAGSCLFCSASCLFPLAAGVTFQLPGRGTSGQVSFLFFSGGGTPRQVPDHMPGDTRNLPRVSGLVRSVAKENADITEQGSKRSKLTMSGPELAQCFRSVESQQEVDFELSASID